MEGSNEKVKPPVKLRKGIREHPPGEKDPLEEETADPEKTEESE